VHRLVAKKILDRLGGKIRLAVSGGAPLLESVSRFFLSLGLPLIQGYGLTEFSPVVSTNIPASNLPASVGKPLPGISCRLGTANELLVKGPGLMLGYWQQPERTREAIDAEGWLHTGDQAVMEEGRIHLRGRIKEIIVTSTGEKVAPADLELLLVADPLVDHAMVVGEGRPYLVALLVLNLEGWQKLARKNGLDPQAPASLDAGRLHEQVLARIQGKLHTFPAHAQIRRVALLLDEWSVANGSLTPTMKLKRTVIEHRYGETIDALYEGHEIPASRMNQPWE
jgi:long-chain acyl-CoA synthetase